MKCSRRALASIAVVSSLLGPAFAAEPIETFRNGEQTLVLDIDPTRIGIEFAPSIGEAAARAIARSIDALDPIAIESAPFVAGHVWVVSTRSGTTHERASSAATALAARSDVRSASPRYRVRGYDETYFLTHEILVRYREGVDAATIATVERTFGLVKSASLDYARNPGVVYRLPQGRVLDAFAIVNGIVDRGVVEFAIPDFAVTRVPKASTNDPLYGNQWHLESTGQSGAVVDADVDIEGAWDVTRGDPSVIVAVVDTGCQLNHPDLVANLVPGIDVLDDDSNPTATDYFFGLFTENHGTSVAGITAGRGDNGIGISGAAQLCRVMPVRFLSEFILVQPTIQDEADAFNFARGNGAAIINNSWGPVGAAPLPASTQAAIDDCVTNGRGGLGTMVFFAAGNESSSVDQNGYAAYANTIAVSASTDQDLFASYSNFGNSLDFCAPSNGGVTSGTWTTDRLGSVGYSSGDYTGAFGGTSSASPLAAGVAALVMSANPYLSWDEVRDVLRDTAVKIDPAGGAYDGAGYSTKYGFGKVNAAAAVAEALNRPPHGVVLYGAGKPGTGGATPKLTANSVAFAGNASFALALSNALPNGSGTLAIGFAPASIPILGGTLLVDVIGPSFLLGGLVTNGAGALTLPLPIPTTPSPVGVTFHSQWIGADPGATFGTSFSNGVAVTIQ